MILGAWTGQNYEQGFLLTEEKGDNQRGSFSAGPIRDVGPLLGAWVCLELALQIHDQKEQSLTGEQGVVSLSPPPQGATPGPRLAQGFLTVDHVSLWFVPWNLTTLNSLWKSAVGSGH